jgi:chromate transporter
VFIPSFLFVALLNPLIPKMRKSPLMSAFLDAINVAAVAVIAAVLVEMGKATFHDWRSMVIALAGLIVVFVFKKLNSAYLVIGSAFVGYLLSLI